MRVMTQPGAAQGRDTVNRALEQDLENQHHEAIKKLAYRLWIDRGRPANSAQRDWLEAEAKLMQRLIPSARH